MAATRFSALGAAALLAAGALTVVESWQQLADLVLPALPGSRAPVATGVGR